MMSASNTLAYSFIHKNTSVSTASVCSLLIEMLSVSNYLVCCFTHSKIISVNKATSIRGFTQEIPSMWIALQFFSPWVSKRC